MRATRLLMELESLAEKLGVQVVYERLTQGRGGLCRLHDKRFLFVEKRLDPEQKTQVLLEGLCRLPLDEVYLLPEVRDLLEATRQRLPSATDEEEVVEEG